MNALEVKGLTKAYPEFTLDKIGFCVPQAANAGRQGCMPNLGGARLEPCSRGESLLHSAFMRGVLSVLVPSRLRSRSQWAASGYGKHSVQAACPSACFLRVFY